MTSSKSELLQERTEPDVNIAPTGGVQEKASAFSTPKVQNVVKIKLWKLTSICEGQVPSQAELSEDQEKREQLGVGHAEEVPAAVGQHRLEAR